MRREEMWGLWLLIGVGCFKLVAGDCREDCLDDFKMDLEDCMECKEQQSAQTFINCFRHCPNDTTNPRLAALHFYLLSTAASPHQVSKLDLELYLSQKNNNTSASGVCMGDYDACRETDEWLAWIHVEDLQHQQDLHHQRLRIVISGRSQHNNTLRQVCLAENTAWIPNGTCSGPINFLCDHRCYKEPKNVCLRAQTVAANGPPPHARCAPLNDVTLFHLLSLIRPSHTITLI